jgi:hypothetical protein
LSADERLTLATMVLDAGARLDLRDTVLFTSSGGRADGAASNRERGGGRRIPYRGLIRLGSGSCCCCSVSEGEEFKPEESLLLADAAAVERSGVGQTRQMTLKIARANPPVGTR